MISSFSYITCYRIGSWVLQSGKKTKVMRERKRRMNARVWLHDGLTEVACLVYSTSVQR